MLRDNYDQNVLLGNARAQQSRAAAGAPPADPRAGGARRARPRAGGAARRRGAGARRADGLGLTSPEFAVLLAYVKIALEDDLAPTACRTRRGPAGAGRATSRRRCASGIADQMAAHPLRREIVTTVLVNEMVNRGGITFVFRAVEETGAAAGAGRAGVRRVPRRLRPAASSPRSRRWTTWCRPRRRPALYLEFRRLLDRAVRWFLHPAAPHRRRRRDRAVPRPVCRAGAAAARAGPGAERGGWSSGPSGCRRWAPAGAGPGGRPARPVHAAGHRRDRRRTGSRPSRTVAGCTSTRRSAYGVDEMLHADHASCRAATGGRPWPAGRCATTCTRVLESLTRSVLVDQRRR